jgi:hypothetical protein
MDKRSGENLSIKGHDSCGSWEMYPAKDLEDEILSAACKTEDLTVPQLIDTVLKSIGDDGPSKKTVRKAIDHLADGGFFLQGASLTIHPTSKARREVARCQEDA